MNKILIVFMILLAGCILISASTAVDIDVKSIDPSDSYVSSIEQNSLNDLNDSNVGFGTKSTDDKDISQLRVTKSFTDLNNLIQGTTSGDTLYLSADDVYRYTGSESTYKKGITINNPIVIDGNGCTIDGSGLVRAFNITANNVIIKNIKFLNNEINTSTDIFGGAIACYGNDCSVINCNFTNSSGTIGGAIFWNGANGTINSCIFTNSKASTEGGAIYLNLANESSVSDSTFINCYSDYQGGAIFWGNGVDGTLNNCGFINCSAKSGGGAIRWYGANGTLNNSNFINSSSENGGAIRWYGANGTLNNSNFINSSSESGGAIEWNGANGKLSDCNFFNSSVEENGYGGAIFWYGVDGSVSNCNFTNSNADYGGAIFWLRSNGSIINSNFINFTAKEGSAIYIYDSSLSITNCTLTPRKDDKNAPIYNEGTILSPVEITTINGKTKKVTNGEVVNLTGIVTTSGIRVAGNNLTFIINGNSVNATSDETGLYSAMYTVDFEGTEPVNANYTGATGNQNVTKGKLTTTISKIITTVTINPIKGKVGEKVKVTATVTDKDENLVPEGMVTFELNGQKCAALIKDGIATTYVTLPSNAGNYTLTAYYAGDDTYQDACDVCTVEVSAKEIPDPNHNPNPNSNLNPKNDVNNSVGNMENTGNPLLVILVALCAIGLESLRRKF